MSYPTRPAPTKPWRWLATTSIVCGLLGGFGLLSVAGLICGMVAVDRAKVAHERATAAWWGIGLSAVSLLWSAGLLYAAFAA
jgi:hypothetical protein